jgi:hypothetical protein
LSRQSLLRLADVAGSREGGRWMALSCLPEESVQLLKSRGFGCSGFAERRVGLAAV